MRIDEWWTRIGRRSDMTANLIHLTKPKVIDGKKILALEMLVKILKEKKLIGSTTSSGFIVGNRRAVCFQDTPIYSLSQNIDYEYELNKEKKFAKERYSPIGLAFHKTFIYESGGRPVIYDKTIEAKEYLPKNQWWRIVNLDLSDEDSIVDWTHEREWRLPGDLIFSLESVSIIVNDYDDVKELKRRCTEEKINLDKVASIITLQDILY